MNTSTMSEGASISVDPSVEIDNDIDRSYKDLGCDQNDDCPPRSAIRFQRKSPKASSQDVPIHSRYSPCFVPTWSFNTANKSPMTLSRSVRSPTRWSISR